MGIGCGECNPYQRLSAFSGNATTIVFRFEPFCPAEPAELVEAELPKLKDQSRLCIALKLQAVVIELDSKVVEDLLKKELNNPNDIDVLVADCRNYLRNIPIVRIQHYYREGYKCADALARRGASLSQNFSIFLEPPSDVALLLSLDAAGTFRRKQLIWRLLSPSQSHDLSLSISHSQQLFIALAHPNHAKFLNKKIEIFDEMALVLGKDMATGGFSKGVGDIGVEALDDSPPLVDANVDDVSKKKQVDPSHVASNETWSHRKRSHATMIEDAVYQDLSIQLGKVASAIEKISENQLNFGSLYEEVMKMDGSFSSILDPFLQSDIPASQNDAARANPSPTMLKNSVELPEQHPSTPVLEQHPLPSPSSPVSPSSSTSAEPPCSPP
nr:putative ribonuclease h protein [Quercus suber]